LWLLRGKVLENGTQMTQIIRIKHERYSI